MSKGYALEIGCTCFNYEGWQSREKDGTTQQTWKYLSKMGDSRQHH